MSGAYGDSEDAGERWVARPVRGQDARKRYRCPGCDQDIRIGEPHVVAWSQDTLIGVEGRRHWHTACWRARHRTPARHRRRS